MFRFTFEVTYTTKDGRVENMESDIDSDSDNVYSARGEMAYRLSRNPNVFAPYSFELKNVYQRICGKWEAYYQLKTEKGIV